MASKLIVSAPHEAEIQLEFAFRQAFELLQPKLRPPFPLTIPSSGEYVQLNKAILYGVLCEPHLAAVHMKHLHAVVTDGYELFSSFLGMVVNELYVKLVDSAKAQLIWVANVMLDVSAVGVDDFFVCLLRRIVGGDVSDANLWLSYELVSLCLLKWDCLLEEHPHILTSALYTYLRLLAHHCNLSSNQKLEALRQLESKFCMKMLNEQFHLCLNVGRDLVRLLQDLVHVPMFRSIWKTLILKGGESGASGVSELSQLYLSQTPRQFFFLRVTPEVETQLRFILTHVKFGNHKRHEAWFIRNLISSPDKETCVIDIIRFICCACKQPGDSKPGMVPRWAIIGSLLKCCRKNYVQANAKLALFYDWLFFDEKVDNIMSIEPAMLLMVNSVTDYIEFTNSLIDFLHLLSDEYDIDRKNIIVRGISSAFNALVQRGILCSMDVFTSCSELSPSVRNWVKTFLLDSRGVGASENILPANVLPHHLPHEDAPVVSHRTPEQSSEEDSAFNHTDVLNTSSADASLIVENPAIASAQAGSMNVFTSCSKLSPSVRNSVKTLLLDSRGVGASENILPANVSPHHLPHEEAPVVSHRTPEQSSEEETAFNHTDVLNTSCADASLTVENPAIASSQAGSMNGFRVETIESQIQDLREAFKKSKTAGIQYLESILLSFLNPCTQKQQDGLICSQVLASMLAKEFQSHGYNFFSSLEVSADAPGYDDELASPSALLFRTYIFSQHSKMCEMLLFWAASGLPVGARFLSYVSRLAYEVCQGDYEEKEIARNRISDSGAPLLLFHLDAYRSFPTSDQEVSLETIFSHDIDKKFLAQLVENAFAAYKCFLTLQSAADMAQSRLLFSDLRSCSEWRRTRAKFLLCRVFTYLSDLSSGDEDIIRLIISLLDDVELAQMQFEIGSRKLSLLGIEIGTVIRLIKSSFKWDYLEQHRFWSLVRADLAVSVIQVEKVILELFFDETVVNSIAIAVAGLLAVCSSRVPTPELVGAVMLFPNNTFPDFSAACLASWVVSNETILVRSLHEFLENIKKTDCGSLSGNQAITRINHSAVLWLLDYAKSQNVNGTNFWSNFSLGILD